MGEYFVKTMKIIAIVLFCLACFGCNSEIKEDYTFYKPEVVGYVRFPLDSLTSFNNHFQQIGEGDESYLVLLTAYKNRFVIYDIQSQYFIRSFSINSDGKDPISVGGSPASGFYYANKDSIILFDYDRQKVFLGNEKGEKQLLVSLRKQFPTERDFWGGAFQGAPPLIINDTMLSITGAIAAGKSPLTKDKKSDLNVNLLNKVVTKSMGIPDDYKIGNYYPTTRLRPSRALDKAKGRLYYSFQNSDSIQVVDLTTGIKETTFFASHIMKLPTIETNDFAMFRTYEDGVSNQQAYNKSQGTFLAVFYNSNRDQIIRLGHQGIPNFQIEEYKEGLYKNEKVLSFYSAKDYQFLGNLSIEDLGYDFMFFDEDNFYMAQIAQNKSEDELVFTKFKYPDF